MKHSEYIQHAQFVNRYGKYLEPINDVAIELMATSKNGEKMLLKDATQRDMKFHAAYFGMLGFIYDNLTVQFQKAVPKGKFYQFLKELQGHYDLMKVGTLEVKNYHSISFGRMSQKTFEQYVKEQLPFIYENVIRAVWQNDERMANMAIDAIEDEWEKYLAKL